MLTALLAFCFVVIGLIGIYETWQIRRHAHVELPWLILSLVVTVDAFYVAYHIAVFGIKS